MAAATATLTVTNQWLDRVYRVTGTIAIGASPLTYTLGGISLNLNQADVKASRTLENAEIHGQSGYIYAYVKGTDNSNGLLKIFAQTNAAAEDAPLGELADAVAIPAAVSSDVIAFQGQWKGML